MMKFLEDVGALIAGVILLPLFGIFYILSVFYIIFRYEVKKKFIKVL